MFDLTENLIPQFPGIHLGAPTMVGPLTVFPVWTDAPVPRRRIPVQLPAGATLGELADGGQVDTLELINPTGGSFILIEGSLLKGGLQDRVLVHDMFITGRHPARLPVRCVEHGRWADRRATSVDGRRAPLRVQRVLRGVNRDPHERPADQSRVWAEVRSYEGALGSSNTGSLVDMYDLAHQQADRPIPIPDPLYGQRGVVVGIGGHPIVAEVFDHPRTFAEQWPGIAAGLLASVTDARPVVTTGRRARFFAERLSGRELQPFAPGGAGTLAEVSDDLVSARTLTTHGARGMHTLHASALNIRHQLVAA